MAQYTEAGTREVALFEPAAEEQPPKWASKPVDYMKEMAPNQGCAAVRKVVSVMENGSSLATDSYHMEDR